MPTDSEKKWSLGNESFLFLIDLKTVQPVNFLKNLNMWDQVVMRLVVK